MRIFAENTISIIFPHKGCGRMGKDAPGMITNLSRERFLVLDTGWTYFYLEDESGKC